MIDLIRIIVKHGGFILFIIFELIAFYLIINYNQSQGEIFLQGTSDVSTAVSDRYNNINSYFDLNNVNAHLNQNNSNLFVENQNLKDRIDALSCLIDSSLIFTVDTSQIYKSIGARVISNSISKRNNYFILDKGSAEGIEKGLGVLSNNKPVGHIIKSSEHYSKVISLLNTNFNLSCKLKNANFIGNITWEPQSPLRAKLNTMPKHSTVAVGDTIVTSGFSMTFPPDLLIGIVKEVNLPKGSNYFDISLTLFEDLSQLNYVYVIQNKHSDELKELQKD